MYSQVFFYKKTRPLWPCVVSKSDFSPYLISNLMLLSFISFGKLHTSFKSTTNAKITILQIIIRNINISVGHNLSKIPCIISFIHYTSAVKISFKLLLWATNSEEFFCYSTIYLVVARYSLVFLISFSCPHSFSSLAIFSATNSLSKTRLSKVFLHLNIVS